MKLPAGITGFYDSFSKQPPSVDLKQISQDLYAAIRKLSGTVLEKPSADTKYASNYVEAAVSLDGDPFRIVVNFHHPLVAFARPQTESDDTFYFLDHTALANALSFTESYNILTKSELATPLSSEHLELLNDAELQQIKYWHPKTIGEVVFNHWD